MWNLLKPLIFSFDAENVHELSLKLIESLGSSRPQVLEWASAQEKILDLSQNISFLGKNLKSPVGLAAGFDKNARILPYLIHLGFSSAEIGSVTLRPQSGNPKPRLFRGDQRLFNFMGFNNEGAELIAKRLSQYQISENFLLGINIGLNKETPHEKAAEEYARCFDILKSFGDYFVINVSSPNTPGLRALQDLTAIEKIFSVLKRISSTRPIFLKLAPELEESFLSEFFARASQLGIDGFVLTNTLGGVREGSRGGWSGIPLTELSRDRLAFARSQTSLPIISVGGIMDDQEAIERKKRGANLIQIYTGWVFGGPRFPLGLAQAWKDS
jgi:dihydroorotate dehydrogenase